MSETKKPSVEYSLPNELKFVAQGLFADSDTMLIDLWDGKNNIRQLYVSPTENPPITLGYSACGDGSLEYKAQKKLEKLTPKQISIILALGRQYFSGEKFTKLPTTHEVS